MYKFIVKRRPASYNSWVKESAKGKAYKTAIENSLKEYNNETTFLRGELYGTIFHFYNKNLKTDVDNLSKPLWDCLTGILYDDDFQIKIRLAGSFDLTKNDWNILNFSGLDGKLIEKLLEAFENEEHILYVECGTLNHTMFKFNIEDNGN